MSQKPNIATTLTEAVLATEAMLFLDQHKNAWIAFNGDGTVVSKINSSDCKQFITLLSYKNLNNMPTSTTINQVVQALEAHANFGQKRYDLDVSIVRSGKAILYDLGEKAVHIDGKKWSIVKKPPIAFVRPSHQQPQVMPKRGGDIKRIFDFVNITNESDQLLFLCWLIATFVPDIQRAVLNFYGTQGAGKTTPMQIVKKLVDHSELDLGISLPKKEDDFVLTASHNYLMFYDNLSEIKEWQSDLLSKAVTGTAFIARRLYTNSEVFVYKFKRAIILNGISQVVAKSDLLDRSWVMQLERITPEKRIEPSVMEAEFDKAKPYILGAIFDILVQAIPMHPKIKPQKWTRTADYDHWGCAIAEVLGYGQEKFMQARNANLQLQNDHAIEANAVGQAIVEFMSDKSRWSGTPSELYGLLLPIWTKQHLEKPKDASRLSKAINALTPNLQAQGINVKFSRPKDRNITLTKTTDGTDSSDGKNG